MEEGIFDGITEGWLLGNNDGIAEGWLLGCSDGIDEGWLVGERVGDAVGGVTT